MYLDDNLKEHMCMYLKNYNVYILSKIQIALAFALLIWIFIPISLSVQNR